MSDDMPQRLFPDDYYANNAPSPRQYGHMELIGQDKVELPEPCEHCKPHLEFLTQQMAHLIRLWEHERQMTIGIGLDVAALKQSMLLNPQTASPILGLSNPSRKS